MKFSTSDIPTEGLLSDKAVNNIADLGYGSSFILWSYNIDAPDYTPAGSTMGSMYKGEFLGAVSRSIYR
jgi:hypothetical protein